MSNDAGYQTRLERVLGIPLAEDALRQWPQSGELIRGSARIAEVESHFAGLKLGVGRRRTLGDTLIVEWSTDYGDGRVYRNVAVAELRECKAARVSCVCCGRASRGRASLCSCRHRTCGREKGAPVSQQWQVGVVFSVIVPIGLILNGTVLPGLGLQPIGTVWRLLALVGQRGGPGRASGC